MFTSTSKYSLCGWKNSSHRPSISCHLSFSHLSAKLPKRPKSVILFYTGFILIFDHEIGALLPSASVEPQSGHCLHNMHVLDVKSNTFCRHFKCIIVQEMRTSVTEIIQELTQKQFGNEGVSHGLELTEEEENNFKKTHLSEMKTSYYMLTASSPPTSKRYQWKPNRAVPCRADFVVGKVSKVV